MCIKRIAGLRRTLIIFFATTVTFIAGCADVIPGGSSSDPLNFSGNWSFSAVSSAASSPNNFALGGFLATKQGTMTGLMRVLIANNSPCIQSGAVLAFSGTEQTDGTFSISSTSEKGMVLTISGTIGSGYLGTGTGVSPYTVTGACQDNGKSLGNGLVPINGIYQGSTKPGSDATGVIGNFQQSSTVNSAGEFPLSGTLSFQGSSCLTTVTMDASTSYVSGDGFVGNFSGIDTSGRPVTVTLNGNYTNKDMSFDYTVTGGDCNGGSGSAELPM